jgi:hypothetical protein
MYQHYLITLFNIGVYDNPESSEWIDKRLELFQTLTTKSVLNNDHSFVWIILVDYATPSDHFQRLKLIAIQDHRIQLIKLTQPLAFGARHTATIRNVLNVTIKKTLGLVLTTLIDSDDVLCDDFFERLYESVRQNIHLEKPILFEPNVEFHTAIELGLCKKRLHHTSGTATPSILSATLENILTVRDKPHGKLGDDCKSHIRFDSSYIHTTHRHNNWNIDYWLARKQTFDTPLSKIIYQYRNTFKRTAVLLLSPPRSGSSALAGILHNLGCSLGKNINQCTDQWNAKGYFENKTIYDFNRHHCGIFSKEIKDDSGWEKLASIIQSEFENDTTFVIKDPRIVHLFKCYLRALSSLGIHIKVINLKRQLSHQSLLNFPPSKGLPRDYLQSLVYWYFQQIERLSQPFESITLNLETLPQHIKRLCDFIPIVYNEELFKQFFDSSLIHFGCCDTLSPEKKSIEFENTSTPKPETFKRPFPWRSPLVVANVIKDIIKDKIVCDIGCGEGDLLVEMSKHAKKVLGIEIDVARYTIAKNRGLDVTLTDWRKSTLPQADVYHIWIGNNNIVCEWVFHHINNATIILGGKANTKHLLEAAAIWDGYILEFPYQEDSQLSGWDSHGLWWLVIIQAPKE